MSKQPEAKITEKICAYLDSQKPSVWHFKVHGGMFQQAGVPDIVGCKNGRFFALEVKTEAGTPTKLQEYVMNKIKAAGGISGVVRSVEDAKRLLDK
jgi:hypothetical protein